MASESELAEEGAPLVPILYDSQLLLRRWERCSWAEECGGGGAEEPEEPRERCDSSAWGPDLGLDFARAPRDADDVLWSEVLLLGLEALGAGAPGDGYGNCGVQVVLPHATYSFHLLPHSWQFLKRPCGLPYGPFIAWMPGRFLWVHSSGLNINSFSFSSSRSSLVVNRGTCKELIGYTRWMAFTASS